MATIVEMINPLTGLPEQVDKLDHTAQEIDDAVALAPQLSNPNLLDNWYFGNPVNQRGQTSYTGAGYGIDRWDLLGGQNPTILIENGHIKLTGSGFFRQIIPVSQIPRGTVVTMSILMASGELYALTTTVPDYQVDSSQVNFPGGFLRIYGWTADTDLYFMFFETEVSPVAMKLELGGTQTLAHQDADGNWVLNEIPDYGEQLARCQRYFQTFATESLRHTDALDFRPVMRTNPALSTITVGGKTLYTANADL